MTINFNPLLTTNNAGGFSVASYGFVQGVMMDDPAVRFAIAGGILATTETLPMWGGVGIFADVPSTSGELGPNVGRATTLTQTSATGLIGFSIFNQAHAWINWPQSPVPTGQAGMTVPYVPLGSGARIAVACDPSLVSLEGGSLGQQVSWDFNNQILQPYDAATATYALSSVTWASTNGGQLTVVASVATPVAAVGDRVNISGATNSGTGGTAVINNNFVVSAFTDNEHFVLAAPAASGVFGTIGGSPVLNYGTGALACKILRIQSGNSKTVTWDSVNNVATWNNSGTAALIQI